MGIVDHSRLNVKLKRFWLRIYRGRPAKWFQVSVEQPITGKHCLSSSTQAHFMMVIIKWDAPSKTCKTTRNLTEIKNSIKLPGGKTKQLEIRKFSCQPRWNGLPVHIKMANYNSESKMLEIRYNSAFFHPTCLNLSQVLTPTFL